MQVGRLQLVHLEGRARPLPVVTTDTRPCPYFGDRPAVYQIVLADDVEGSSYQQLMDRRFRRSGRMFYRPHCPTCRLCVPIRVPVDEFRPSRSQRRVLRRNADVRLDIRPIGAARAEEGRPSGPARCLAEQYELYRRYQLAVHGQAPESRSELELGLYDSGIETLEMSYRVGGRLVAVGIVDLTPRALSSVYCFYDPDEARRSLGTFSALCEIQEARRRGLTWWYIGYHIAGCPKMEYKLRFRPCERLGPQGLWRRV